MPSNERPVKDEDVKAAKWLEKQIDLDEKDEPSYQKRKEELIRELSGLEFKTRARLPFVLEKLKEMEEQGSRREPRLSRIKELITTVRASFNVATAREGSEDQSKAKHTPESMLFFFGIAWLPTHEKEIESADEDGFERVVESLHANLVKHENEQGFIEAITKLYTALIEKQESFNENEDSGATLYLRYFELASVVNTFLGGPMPEE